MRICIKQCILLKCKTDDPVKRYLIRINALAVCYEYFQTLLTQSWIITEIHIVAFYSFYKQGTLSPILCRF